MRKITFTFCAMLLILFGIAIGNKGFSQTTTIITHGYTSDNSEITGWMTQMADTIRTRVGNGVVKIYNKTTGNFDYSVGSGNNTILLFDWMFDSNDMHFGFSEGAGDALFAALINGYQQNDFTLAHLHFIGHSRGCAVNSEAVERLLVAGFPVEQVTYIDAHDYGAVNVCTDYDCNPDSIHSGVEGWNGIGWADSYWQNPLIGTSGRAVEGTYSEYLGTIGHSAIREWYTHTIADASIHTGFYYSLLGGGSSSRPPETGIKRTPFFTFETDGIMNGNFERGFTLLGDNIAGWWYHGGNGNAQINNNAHLLLDPSHHYVRHNRFYIPPNASKITFDFIINSSISSDELIALINQDTTMVNTWGNWSSGQMTNWINLSFDVYPYRNTVKTLTFLLINKNGDSTDITSKIMIDNIHFIMTSASVTENKYNIEPVNIYPNPANDNITIETGDLGFTIYDLQIYDVIGNLVLEKSIANNKTSINIATFSKGLYFLKVENENGITMKKFIKE